MFQPTELLSQGYQSSFAYALARYPLLGCFQVNSDLSFY